MKNSFLVASFTVMVRSSLTVIDKCFFNDLAWFMGAMPDIEGLNVKIDDIKGVNYNTCPIKSPKAYFEGDVVFIKIGDEVVFSGVCDGREYPPDVNEPVNAFSPRNLIGNLEPLDNTRDWMHIILRLQSEE
jgi:hypothetical protein